MPKVRRRLKKCREVTQTPSQPSPKPQTPKITPKATPKSTPQKSPAETPKKTPVKSPAKIPEKPPKDLSPRPKEEALSTSGDSNSQPSEFDYKQHIDLLVDGDLPYLEEFISEISTTLLTPLEHTRKTATSKSSKDLIAKKLKAGKTFHTALQKAQKRLFRSIKNQKIKTINPYTYGAYLDKPKMYKFRGQVDTQKIPNGEGELIYFYPKLETTIYGQDKNVSVTHYKGFFRKGGPHGSDVTILFSNGVIWFQGEMQEGWFDGFGRDYYLDGTLR